MTTTLHTIRHAIEYLREAHARPLSKRTPVAALYAVTRHVKQPCRAIGLAREALIKHESIPAAIEALTQELECGNYPPDAVQWSITDI